LVVNRGFVALRPDYIELAPAILAETTFQPLYRLPLRSKTNLNTRIASQKNRPPGRKIFGTQSTDRRDGTRTLFNDPRLHAEIARSGIIG
jgi:hypothetical protein